jgi:hypothetical protein
MRARYGCRMDADRRLGAGLVAAGGVPLALGAVIPPSAVLDGPDVCPFRAVTGIPCPLCGATRAFVLAGHGDGAFASYGAFWLVVAAVCVVLGLAVLARTVDAEDVRAAVRGRRRVVPLLTALLAAGWAYALAHRETIASG